MIWNGMHTPFFRYALEGDSFAILSARGVKDLPKSTLRARQISIHMRQAAKDASYVTPYLADDISNVVDGAYILYGRCAGARTLLRIRRWHRSRRCAALGLGLILLS